MIMKVKLRVLTSELKNPTLITEMSLIKIDMQNGFHSTLYYR